ncbi:MAG: hypothetical protein K0Q79_3470 [Flavipsychrobacter sp.]|jgi:hypothetical protein|nr:hypothetical protein [Flavipsychrobacter sp.]
MQVQVHVGGLNIAIVKIESQRMLLVNNSHIPYFMAWNDAKAAWCFTDSTTPFELQMHEMELSGIIVTSEA